MVDIRAEESFLITCRRSGRWEDAYQRMELLQADLLGEDLGWLKLQLALTRYLEDPRNARLSLKLTDDALVLVNPNSVHSAKALMNGVYCGLYAKDGVRLTLYKERIKALLTPVPEAVRPWVGRLLTALAYILQDEGKLERAEVRFREAVRFYEHTAGPHGEHDRICQMKLTATALGDVLLIRGQKSEAQAILRRVADRSPQVGAEYVCYLKGQLAVANGQIQAAVACYEAAVEGARQRHDQLLVLKASIALARAYQSIGLKDLVEPMLKPLIYSAAHGRMVPLLIQLQRLAAGTHTPKVVTN